LSGLNNDGLKSQFFILEKLQRPLPDHFICGEVGLEVKPIV
jgi:hypothetical protein